MECSGSCFDLGEVTNHREPKGQWETEKPSSPIYNGHGPDEPTPGTTSLYSPLKPWQTRLLRLPSAKQFSFVRHKRLEARLFVVDLPTIEGAVLTSEQRIVHYTALSYTWGDLPIGHTLLCDDCELPITANLAAALLALQRPEEDVFVWVDAVCINQADQTEVAEQVVNMLQIYQKAELVVGWLGAADAKSALAMSYLRNHSRRGLRARMREAKSISSHLPECLAHVELFLSALMSLLEREWLGRTWVRQEIYGARSLNIRCGSQSLAWHEFASSVDIIQGFAKLLPGLEISQLPNFATVLYLVGEAEKNRVMLQNGSKIPRNFGDVLLMSKHYGSRRVQDTVYGVLGMCAVPLSSSGPNDDATYDPHGGGYVIPVNYSKKVADVYLDAALHLLSTKRAESMFDLWHYYKRSPAHDEDMPTWVTDWREGVCDEAERQAIRKSLEASSRSFNSPSMLAISALVPLLHGHHGCAKATKGDPRVLQMSRKVMTYVAHVSDSTTELKSFISPPESHRLDLALDQRLPSSKKSIRRDCDLTLTLGDAARSIHSEASPRQGHYLFDKTPGVPFQAETHNRRLAILGVWDYPRENQEGPQLALVPATVRKGDLVVAVGHGLLPLLLRPLQGKSVSPVLFHDPDPYEEASHILRPDSDHPRRRKSHGISFNLRAEKVCAPMNEASVDFGKDYEFHGPVFLPVERWVNSHQMSRWYFTTTMWRTQFQDFRIH